MQDKFNLKFICGNKSLDFKEFKIENIDGIDFPSLEINTSSNAHMDGGVIDSVRVDKRCISITADYKGYNKEIMRKSLISFFNPKSYGTLIISYGNIQRAIEYQVEKFQSKLTNIYDDLNFIVDLICVNPYLKEVQESKIQVAQWLPKFHFPLVIPQTTGIIMGLRQPSLIVNIINTGDVETGMIIEFVAKGTLTNPSLTNIGTQQFIKLNRTMESGEVIRVNTNKGKKKVMQNLSGVETDIMNLLTLDSDFLQLAVGDNLLRYNADTNVDNLEVSIYYNPSYLGV